ncbi:hypothetical protein [Pseudorhodoplanes sp.]|uniref:hypothetical protein n=1 Tax=Pseudorhodoplanes sp. TaxID=1934341 RepID=UPI003D112964
MKILHHPDYFGSVIFCDDIRHEIGGKFSFIGVYSGAMQIHGDTPFPCVLPKLGISASYSQAIDAVVIPIKFLVYLPGETDNPSIVFDAPAEAVEQAIQQALAKEKREKESLDQDEPRLYAQVGINAILSPLKIENSGNLRVRVTREDDLVRLGSIKIEAAPKK